MRTFTPLSFIQVQLFRWIEKDDGIQELQTECGYHGHILALHMQVKTLFSVFGIRPRPLTYLHSSIIKSSCTFLGPSTPFFRPVELTCLGAHFGARGFGERFPCRLRFIFAHTQAGVFALPVLPLRA